MRNLRATTTQRNVNAPVVGMANFARESMKKMNRSFGDPGFAVCICGGQGDCIGCEELEVLSILGDWRL